MRLHGRLVGVRLGIAIPSVAAGIIAAGSGAAEPEFEPKCHGKPATYVGTAGRDRVTDDNKDPKLGKNPVLYLDQGRDLVDLDGNYGVIRSLTICTGPADDKVELFEGINAREYWVEGGRGDDKLGNSSPYIEEGFLRHLTIRGGEGDDVLLGGSFPDRIYGGNGRDRVEAGNGDDRVIGGGANDKLFGEGHDDLLRGNEGNDRLVGDSRFYQPGEDTARGGLGNDRCKAEIKIGCES